MKHKAIVFIIIFLVIVQIGVSQEADSAIKIPNGILSPPIGYDFVGFKNGGLFFIFYTKNGKLFIFAEPYREIKKENIQLQKNRYYVLTETLNGKTYTSILIWGGDLILQNFLPFRDMWAKIGFPPKEPEPLEWPFSNVFYFWEDGIKEITASSVLKEKTKTGEEIAYDESQLRKTFYGVHDSTLNMNTYKRAWAEGVPGPGIGETLDIEFTLPADHMMVLNGYVNLQRMDLYTANNRVKTAVVTSENPRFTVEYTFDDVVTFSEIKFPEKTRKVRFTIKDVYKGTKYDDTCITAIYLKQQSEFTTHPYFQIVPQGSKEYYEAIEIIEKRLRKAGLIK